jgi:hypothetical protein
MTQTSLTSGAPSAPAVPAGLTRAESWSVRVFAAAVVAALPLLLWFGRDHWFFLDDWWVLTRDGLISPGYLDGHNGHWITLVRLDYRLNFELWGLRSYLPYQVPVVLAHLAAAVLVRQVARRLGARGWIATGIALPFLFFGSGRENMVWGHEVGATGSLVFGLGLFLLGDGGRSVTRRDWVALGLGFVGLMTWGAFPAILIGFCVTTLLRRGVRIAVFYGLPLGAMYTAWYLHYGRDSATTPRLAGALRFAGRMFWAVFDALAAGGAGALLVGVAGFGLVAAVRRVWRSGTWGDVALPLGLAVSGAAFVALTSLARASYMPDIYASGRYLHIGAALLLPLVAAGAEALARRRTLLGAAALVPLAIGLPSNVEKLVHTEPLFRGEPQMVFAMAHSPFVDRVPPDATPPLFGPFDGPLTTRWLARQSAAGRIPEPDGTDPVRDLTATNWLVLAQEADPRGQPDCPELTGPLAATLRSGDQIGFTGTITVSVTDGTHESYARRFISSEGSAVRAHTGPVDIVVRPGISQGSGVCMPRGSDG